MSKPAAEFDIKANDRTKKAFKSVTANIKKLSVDAAKVVTSVSAVTATAAAGLAFSSARSAKEMTAYADSVGVSVEQLSAWGYAADTVSVSQEKLNDVFRDTADKIGDAFLTGGGAALDVLERLNLNASDMVELAPDEQLLKIAQGLDEVGTQSEKVFLLEALASDASMLLPLLDNNAEKLKELRDEAISSGAALSDMDAAKIKEANEAWDKSASIIQGIGNKLAVEFSPYVTEIANRFKNAATESKGFGEEVKAAMSTAIISVSYLLNAFRAIEFTILSVKLIFQGFAAGMYNTLDRLHKMAISIVNVLPSIDIKPIESLVSITNEANASFNKTKETLTELINKPLPSTEAQKFLTEVSDAAEQAAKKITAVKDQASYSNAANDAESPSLVKAREEIQKKFEMFEESRLSEEGRMVLAYERQQAIVENAFDAELINRERHDEILINLELEHQAKLDEIEANKVLKEQEASDKKLAIQMDYYDRLYNLEAGSQQAALNFSNAMRKNDLKGALQNGAAMLGNAAKTSKEAFEVQKALSFANATVTLPSAVVKSFEAGGGYPWGLIPAGFMLDAGLKQINAIKSSSFGGGGGSVPSVGGGGSTSSSAPVASGLPPGATALPGREEQQQIPDQVEPVINITINGNILGNEDFVEDVAAAVKQAKERDL